MAQTPSPFNTPTIPLISNPVGVDAIIQTLQLSFRDNLAWLEYSFGRAYIRSRKTDNERYSGLLTRSDYIFPALWQGDGKDQINGLANDNLDSYCFFLKTGNETPIEYEQFNRNNYNADISVIFWMDLKRVDNTSTYPNTEYYLQSVKNIIKSTYLPEGSSLEITSIEEEPNQLYREFTIDLADTQHIYFPKYGFRVNMECIVNEDCNISLNRVLFNSFTATNTTQEATAENLQTIVATALSAQGEYNITISGEDVLPVGSIGTQDGNVFTITFSDETPVGNYSFDIICVPAGSTLGNPRVVSVILNVQSSSVAVSPQDITGALFVPDIRNISRSLFNVYGYQINNIADATKNMKLLTGGVIDVNSNTTDYFDFNEVQLNDFTVLFEVENTFDGWILGDINDDNNNFLQVSQFNNNINIRFNSVSNFIGNISGLSSGYHLFMLVRNGSSLSLYIDGSLNDSTTVGTQVIDFNQMFRRRNGNFGDGLCSLISIIPSAENATFADVIYNTIAPNEIISSLQSKSADVVYTFTDLSVLNSGTIKDYSGNGNDATFSTTAVGAYSPLLTNSEAGIQLSMHSYSLSGDQLILASDPDSIGQDVIWKQHYLNLLLDHSGSESINIGSVRTMAFGLYVDDASVSQTIFETGGQNIVLFGGSIVCSDFNTITVDLSTNAVPNATLVYVELKNVTDVDFSAFRINQDFEGKIISPVLYDNVITQSIGLKAWFDSIY